MTNKYTLVIKTLIVFFVAANFNCLTPSSYVSKHEISSGTMLASAATTNYKWRQYKDKLINATKGSGAIAKVNSLVDVGEEISAQLDGCIKKHSVCIKDLRKSEASLQISRNKGWMWTIMGIACALCLIVGAFLGTKIAKLI